MADVFPESMDRLDYEDLNKSVHTIEEYIRYICERVDYTYGQLFKDIGQSGVLAVPIAIAVSELQKDTKELQNQMAGVSAEATSALNKASRLESVVGDADSGLVKTVNDILTTIGSDEAGHESGILGALKELDTKIGSDEAGHESGILGALKEITDTIGSDETGHESGILGDIKEINTTIGSDEVGHESGILGDVKDIKDTIGSDETGHESGILGELKDHEQRITALENQ